MSDIKKAMTLIAGVEPSAAQVQRVQAIAHSLNIPSNDAMFPILLSLDAYYGAFSTLPEQAQQAAKKAAEAAEKSSKVAVDRAVAMSFQNLAPTAREALASAAKEAVGNMAAGFKAKHEKELQEMELQAILRLSVIALVFIVVSFIGCWMAYTLGHKSGVIDGKTMSEKEVITQPTQQEMRKPKK